jgi:hypothetical protein
MSTLGEERFSLGISPIVDLKIPKELQSWNRKGRSSGNDQVSPLGQRSAREKIIHVREPVNKKRGT